MELVSLLLKRVLIFLTICCHKWQSTGRFDLEIKAKGDDIHHITEDVGICLGGV